MRGRVGRVSELSRRNRCDSDGGEECGEDEQPGAERGHLLSPPVNVSHARAVKNSTQKMVRAVILSPVLGVQVVGVFRKLEHAVLLNVSRL